MRAGNRRQRPAVVRVIAQAAEAIAMCMDLESVLNREMSVAGAPGIEQAIRIGTRVHVSGPDDGQVEDSLFCRVVSAKCTTEAGRRQLEQHTRDCLHSRRCRIASRARVTFVLCIPISRMG